MALSPVPLTSLDWRRVMELPVTAVALETPMTMLTWRIVCMLIRAGVELDGVPTNAVNGVADPIKVCCTMGLWPFVWVGWVRAGGTPRAAGYSWCACGVSKSAASGDLVYGDCVGLRVWRRLAQR